VSIDRPTTTRREPVASAEAFADALRGAIEASGLGLERVQHRLKLQGVNVSVATLSYWQSGRSMPGRRVSFETLSKLEDVLGVPPGALAKLVPPRSTGRDSVATFAASMGQGIEVPESIAELDARLRRQFEMVSEHATVTVGSDRAQHSRWTRRVLRAIADGVDRILLADHVDDDSAPPPRIEPLAHCELGGRYELPASNFVITELLFDRVLAKDDSMMIEYLLHYGPPYPLDTSHEERKQMPLREFVMEVRFAADAIPTHCEWYEISTREPDAKEKVRVLDINSTRSVLVVRHDLPPSQFGMRWYWD
jgi:transcriptional regulator with XRE-family HTH domain